METINERIKEVRKSKGLSQKEFAERIGLRSNSIAVIETGRRNPSERTIKDICEAFAISEEWLKYGKGEPEDRKAVTLIDELKRDYKLNDFDTALVMQYLKLDATQRKIIRDFFYNTLDLTIECYSKELPQSIEDLIDADSQEDIG